MGLGKTLQMIALIASDKENDMQPKNLSHFDQYLGSTLVIVTPACKKALVTLQWLFIFFSFKEKRMKIIINVILVLSVWEKQLSE